MNELRSDIYCNKTLKNCVWGLSFDRFSLLKCTLHGLPAWLNTLPLYPRQVGSLLLTSVYNRRKITLERKKKKHNYFKLWKILKIFCAFCRSKRFEVWNIDFIYVFFYFREPLSVSLTQSTRTVVPFTRFQRAITVIILTLLGVCS